MALSDDQKAMLRLLAQRRAGLRGPGRADGPRASTRSAPRSPTQLAQLDAEGEPVPAMPPAPPAVDSAPPAGGVSVRSGAPGARSRPARSPHQSRRQSQLRPLPSRPHRRPPRPAPPKRTPPPRPKLSLPEGGGARAAIAAGARRPRRDHRDPHRRRRRLGDTTPATPTTAAEADRHHRRQLPRTLTQAVLRPSTAATPPGSPPSAGSKNSLALQIEAKAWSRAGKGESYTVWLSSRRRKCCRWRLDHGRRERQDRRPGRSPDRSARPTSPTKPSTRSTSPCTDDADPEGVAGESDESKRGAELHRHRRPPRHRHRPDRRRRPKKPKTNRLGVGNELAGVHDPGRVELLLDRAQDVEAGRAHLGLHVGGVVAADRVVVGDRAAAGDDRLAGGPLDLPPLLELRPVRGAREMKVK